MKEKIVVTEEMLAAAKKSLAKPLKKKELSVTGAVQALKDDLVAAREKGASLKQLSEMLADVGIKASPAIISYAINGGKKKKKEAEPEAAKPEAKAEE